METVGPVIELLRWILAPISRCYDYHSGLEENVETLEQRMEELDCRRRDIHASLGTEIDEREAEPKAEVRLWLRRVEGIDAEVSMIKAQFETVKCFSRAGIGKNVIQKIEDVKKLHESGVFPNGLVIRPRQRIGQRQPTTALGEETTFRRKMEDVLALLMGDEVRKIGIYGMGGVGKTTLMKHINNRLLESRERFGSVIWVAVSKSTTPNIIELQDAVACQFGFYIPESHNVTVRAEKLIEKLTKKTRYLLIIDGLWHAYGLKDVGIPEPGPENESKLVLTTRHLHVCQKMSCSKIIRMECPSEPESCKLFLDTVGGDVPSVQNMNDLVNLFVKECACLPLAIVTIAGSLKGTVNSNDWETALKDLRESPEGTSEIFGKLKFSYDRLNDKTLQDCLLYCALFAKDNPIKRNHLVEKLIARGIITARKTQAQSAGQDVLNKLVEARLLENTSSELGVDRVKMHELISEMAEAIRSKRAGMGLKCVAMKQIGKRILQKFY